MVILNRKRLIAILGMVFIPILVFSFHIAKDENTLETVALPVTNKVIVLDARTSEFQMREQKVVQEQQKQKQI